MKKNLIILILGPSGAGKSTVCKELVKKFNRSAYIEIDQVRCMVKMGHLKPWVRGGQKELLLSTHNSVALAKNFIQNKYNVVIEDVAVEKKQLDLYLKLLKEYAVKIFLLLPDKKVLAHRDGLRPKECQLKQRALDLHDKFSKRIKGEKRWTVLDTSNETGAETMERIYKLIINKK